MSRIRHQVILGAICLGAFQFCGLSAARAQVAAAAPAQPGPLVWDALAKEVSAKPGDAVANFVFTATNISDSEITILDARGSCSCTTAEMPAQPWVLAAHSSGQMKVHMDLAGKTGTVPKSVIVTSTNFPTQFLQVTVHMPDSRQAMRDQNQQMAVANRQAVFKGDCAKCHLEPAQGKLAKELYLAACGVCHEANPRATMVPDLHHLTHPTDYAYWKMMITIGRPGTLMPAFGSVAGGPLTDEQVDSLAKTLTIVFPSRPQPLAQPGKAAPRPNH